MFRCCVLVVESRRDFPMVRGLVRRPVDSCARLHFFNVVENDSSRMTSRERTQVASSTDISTHFERIKTCLGGRGGGKSTSGKRGSSYGMWYRVTGISSPFLSVPPLVFISWPDSDGGHCSSYRRYHLRDVRTYACIEEF